MFTFYWISFILMTIISLGLFLGKGGISALCLIPVVSFITFFALYYGTELYGFAYYLTDSIRVSAIMIVILMCGMKSNYPKLYLAYSVVLFSHILLNSVKLFFLDQVVGNYFYVAITVAELSIFAYGVNITLNAKTKDSTNALLDNNAFDIFHSSRSGIDSSPNAS